MRRLVKIGGWFVVGVLVLVAIAAGALWFGGSAVAAWAIQHPLSTMIGRQIRLDGPLTIEWGAPTKIVADAVHVANASWSQDKEMFSAKRLEIDVFPATLIHGPTQLPLIALDGAKLRLETSADGQGNWDFGLSAATPKTRHQYPNLQRFVVRDSSFVFHNGKTNAETRLGIADLDLDAPNPSAPVKLAGDGTFQGHPLHIAGTVGPITELRNTTKPYPVKLDGTLDQIRLAVDGTLQKPLDFAGLDLRMSLSGEKLAEFAALFGLPLPELPNFRGTAELTGGNGNWMLKALTIALGKSNLEGGIAIDTNEKVPHLQANLTSSYIDLADFKGFYGGRPPNTAAPPKPADRTGRVLPDTAIAVKKLPGVDVDLSFDAARIQSAGGLPIERVSAGLQLKNSTITLKPLRFHTARGDVDLDFRFTPFTTSGPPRLQADVDVRHINLHELLGGPGMPAILRRTAGTVGGFIKLDTTGVSLRDFLGRMNGDAGFFMENGEISDLLQNLAPLDVLGALGVYVTGDRPVEINCLVSRFDIKNGIATASTMLLDTSDTEVIGKGNINFADETLFLTLTPYNKNLTAVSLRTPVDIRGTFKQPQFHLQTGALIARLGAAIGLGIAFPPAALLALVDTGLGENNACGKAFGGHPPPSEAAPTGSSTPPQQ